MSRKTNRVLRRPRKEGEIQTPAAPIRSRCLDCSETEADVRNCRVTGCWLHPWRMGKGPSQPRLSKVMRRPRREGEALTSIKSIRSYCLACAGSSKEVRACPSMDCWLWPYRLGTLPKAEAAPLQNRAQRLKTPPGRPFWKENRKRVSNVAAGAFCRKTPPW